MRTVLLSFKADVHKKVLSGEKIYEHRKVFPDEPIRAFLYVSTPIKAITGIMHLRNKTSLEEWVKTYSYDKKAVQRINEYLKHYRYAMEITDFQNTNMIPLEKLRQDIPGFVVPQMYYFIDNSFIFEYLDKNLHAKGELITHTFDGITSDMICKK